MPSRWWIRFACLVIPCNSEHPVIYCCYICQGDCGVSRLPVATLTGRCQTFLDRSTLIRWSNECNAVRRLEGGRVAPRWGLVHGGAEDVPKAMSSLCSPCGAYAALMI